MIPTSSQHLVLAMERFGARKGSPLVLSGCGFARSDDAPLLFALLTQGGSQGIQRVSFSRCEFGGMPNDFFEQLISHVRECDSAEAIVPEIQFQFDKGKSVPETLRASSKWEHLSADGKTVLEEVLENAKCNDKFKVWIECNGLNRDHFTTMRIQRRENNLLKCARQAIRGLFAERSASLGEGQGPRRGRLNGPKGSGHERKGSNIWRLLGRESMEEIGRGKLDEAGKRVSM